MKLRFSIVADVLFYAAVALLLPLCILRYFRVPLALSLAVSALVSLAAGAIAFLLLYGKNSRRLLGKKEREAREALLLHLALEKPERVRAALLAAYTADGREAHCEGDDLEIDGKLLVPFFSMEPVGADGIARLLRLYGGEFSLAANALTPEAEKLLRSFGVKAELGDDIYALFARTGTMPDPLICGNVPRKSAKQRLLLAVRRSNARPFFVSGALLLLMSLFTFFPVYYIISGSILLACAVAVRLFGYAA